MPTIIPPIARPTTVANANAERRFGGSLSIAEGDIVYSRSDNIRLYWSDHNQVDNITNRGTIWIYSTENVSAAIAGFYIDRIYNFGLIAAESDSGNSYAVSVSALGRAVDNSGTIYAFSRTGQSTALTHWGGADVSITNSGLIAAHSLAGGIANSSGALGLTAPNGALLHNTAAGRILAEGDWAVAVSYGGGGSVFNRPEYEIVNEGLIQALAFDPANRSMGIRASHSFIEPMRILNNGTIRASLAIVGGSSSWPASPSDEVVINSSTGIIEGDIELNLGNDYLENRGVLQGNVILGNGDDRFSNFGTGWTGFADLGWGNDQFNGSEQAERVMGGRGGDTLIGNDGADLLLGGVGNDVLDGGAGNDTIYGEYDDDIIRTLEGDRIFAGSGHDRVTLGDLSFASADGGAGIDTLVLPSAGGTVNIGSVVTNSRVSGFEIVEIASNRAAAFLASDLAAAPTAMRITGNAGSSLVLVGGWTETGMQGIDGVAYRVMSAGGQSLFVQATLALTVQASNPSDLVNIGAVAGGLAAPDLTAQSGVTLSSNVVTDRWSLTEDLVIDREEIWNSNSEYGVISSFLSAATIINHGRIIQETGTNIASPVRIENLALFDNRGSIEAIATGGAYARAYYAGAFGALHNSGYVAAQAVDGDATAALVRRSALPGDAPAFTNSGLVRATSQTGFATGAVVVGMFNGTASNDGDIIAQGGRGSRALQLDAMTAFTNYGNIFAFRQSLVATEGVTAVLVTGIGFRPLSFENYGRIEGETALIIDGYSGGMALNFTNYGGAQVVGDINSLQHDDTITNAGAITGAIRMGAGNDTYDGRGGQQTGGVFGGIGNDTYIIDDQSVLFYENVNEGIDTVVASVGYYLYENIENLRLTPGEGDFFGVGNVLANMIEGNSGANLLIAGAGNDVVNGGARGDSLFGQDGDDALSGDDGVDYLVGGLGNDILRGGNDADALYGEDGDDYLDGGTSFDTDILVAGAGDDTLYGISGQGNPDYDLMDGGAGNDAYYVDTGADLTFEANGGGIDIVYAAVTVPNAGVYLYANVENLVLQGMTAFGVGNELDNQLMGSSSGNWLLGGAGNDSLNGMAGNDVLFGEAGNDIFAFAGGSGADVIGDFTTGQDRIDLSAYGFTFAQLQANFVQVGNDGAINLGNGNIIVLHGVTMNTLTASDFILAPVAEAAPKAGDLESAFGTWDMAIPFPDSGLQRWQPILESLSV